TTRKALISLLNRHLAIILKDNNVLKANQFAGLPKQSTFEPIRIMNEVIQNSIDNNNELWILSQNMGKAYDLVQEEGVLNQQNVSIMAYMDDTQWITVCHPLIEKLPYNQNLDNNTFPSIKGGKIPLEDVVDNAYYSKHRKRLREKNILFLDQIISGDKSHLLLWKEILIKAYVPISSQRKEAKWYTDIRNFITTDSIHLNRSISHLFGARHFIIYNSTL
ncbi:13953_t:CDS:2, partial [Rhizophagus irregularis]